MTKGGKVELRNFGVFHARYPKDESAAVRRAPGNPDAAAPVQGCIGIRSFLNLKRG
jgi:hypothetical protein